MKLAADFRSIARDVLKNKWLIAVIAGLIATLLGAVENSGFEININTGGNGVKVNVPFIGKSFDFSLSPGVKAIITGGLLSIFSWANLPSKIVIVIQNCNF